jgi:hypothetical protein
MGELPDVETLVVVYLRDQLGGAIPVSTRTPNPRPQTFVRAWRTGGRAPSRIHDRAQITVESWSTNTVNASVLARRCRDLLLAAAHGAGIVLARGVSDVGGLYFDPDPETGAARYTFTVQLTVRALIGDRPPPGGGAAA